MPDQQWGPPTGPYPQPGTPGGHYSQPSGTAQQPYPGPQPQSPYQGGYHGGYQQPVYGSHGPPPVNPGFGWGPQFGGPGGPGGPHGPAGPRGFGGPGYGPGGPRRPPKKSNRTGLIVTLSVLGVAIIGVAVLGGLAARKDSGSVATSRPSPAVSSPTIPSPEPTYNPPTTTDPTNAPTTSKPTTTQPTTTKATVPPPKPRPRTPPPPTDREIVQKDKFYATGSMASVGCRLADVRITNRAAVTRYYNAVFGCMNRAWALKVRRGGDTFTPPRLLLVSGPVSGPCGSGASSVSYYCGQNQVIYMRYDLDVKNYNTYPAAYSKVWAKMWALHTIAHEYGHHVQQLSGILSASWNRSYALNDYDARLQESRRRELQASCLGNLFVGANRKAMPITGENLRQWTWSISHTIDPARDHGSQNNHFFWAKRGFNGRNPALCNTFTSSASLVS